MNILEEHKIYEEDFNSKQIFINYVNQKIKLVEEDLREFKEITNKEFDYVQNSQALENYEEKIVEIINGFKNTIKELNKYIGEFK